MRRFEGRHVVVTGGRGALGGSVVDLLTAEGATCHVPDVDLTVEDDTVRWFDGLPPLWASIHVAGGFAMSPLTTTTLADFRAQHDLNAVTCFLSCREAVRNMRAAGGGGRIVNVAARPALVPTAGKGMAAYAASKAVVASLTGTLAAELLDEGILLNAVVPSTMDTPTNRRMMAGADFSRWPSTADIAKTIAFLASADNTTTSGALVTVYGRA